jgi:hypothetical protein
MTLLVTQFAPTTYPFVTPPSISDLIPTVHRPRCLRFALLWRRVLGRIYTAAIGLEILTTFLMNNSIFWDIVPWGLLKPTDVAEENAASFFKYED